jgi:hypothetical protein
MGLQKAALKNLLFLKAAFYLQPTLVQTFKNRVISVF